MESIITFVAGRSQADPGPAGIGIYVTEADGKSIHQVKQAIGNARGDFATYYAVMVALAELKQIFGDLTKDIHFELRLDNEFVKKQLNSETEIKEPGLVPMFVEIHNNRVASFPHISLVVVPAAKNKEAESLALEASVGK